MFRSLQDLDAGDLGGSIYWRPVGDIEQIQDPDAEIRDECMQYRTLDTVISAGVCLRKHGHGLDVPILTVNIRLTLKRYHLLMIQGLCPVYQLLFGNSSTRSVRAAS